MGRVAAVELKGSVMPDLSDSGFQVLQAAVRLARDKQLKTLKSLREQLGNLFPNRNDDIEQAINYWAAYVRKTGI